jgi:hypothetical protein
MADQPGLFDLPAPDVPVAVSRVGRGRAREVYARTVVADVRVQRPAMLHVEALRSFDQSPTVVIGQLAANEAAPDSRESVATDWTAALGWLLDPVFDLWPLIEADAVRLLEVDVDLTGRSGDRCTVSWTVTVKLRDVGAFRDVALARCPDNEVGARAEIGQSLAAAWQWAAEPYAPLRTIPGIDWTPVQVDVHHKPARPGRTA